MPFSKHCWVSMSSMVLLLVPQEPDESSAQSDFAAAWEQTAGFVWSEENCPPTEPGFSQGFFLHSVTDGVLVPLACLWGHFISSDIVHLIAQILFWTELSWMMIITEFNEELPLTENWVFTIVLLHYWHTIFLFNTVKLLWHNLYC